MFGLYKSTIFLTGLFLIATGIAACSSENILENDPQNRTVYREYVSKNDIDPSKGYLGDISDTVKYWKDPDSLEKHMAWSGNPTHNWKLNSKDLDLDRDGLHMGYVAVEQGQELVELLNEKNPGFVSCLTDETGSLDFMGEKYPLYSSKTNKVMTIEHQVQRCSKRVFGKPIKWGSNENNMITMYIKSLSTGKPMQVDITSKPIMEAYNRGKELFYTRAGQFNYACASCHTPQGGALGKNLRGQVPTTVFGDAAHYPVFHTKLGLISMAQRIGQCNFVTRTARLKPGSLAYTDLEVFLSVASNGYPVSVPSMRN